MRFSSDRNVGHSRRFARRLLVAAGLLAFACTFPDYEFPEVIDTCKNGIADGDETQIDCGGSCEPCAVCSDDTPCPESQTCVDGICHSQCEGSTCDPTCDDKILNGDESAIDCGGSCPKKCVTGQPCNSATDCVDGVCLDDECQEAACDDKVQNGTEPWPDCGVDCPYKCANGRPCNVDGDCKSAICADDVCAPEQCVNNEQDGGETDEDCGGTDCPPCNIGDTCVVATDCKEMVCGEDLTCSAPTCGDGAKNGDETGEDCGGPTTCERCPEGASCNEDGDCIDKRCKDGTCSPPACGDGLLNGDESDVDCGGSCEPCPPGKRCKVDDDCATEICDSTTDDPRCVSCGDSIENGDELGPDCGGPDCALCELGGDCSADAGCTSFRCDGGECTEGLIPDYQCYQCGNDVVTDKISYYVTLNNVTGQGIDVRGVSIRYYLSAEAQADFVYICEFEGVDCTNDPSLVATGGSDNTATHYIEVQLNPSSGTRTIAAGESGTLFVDMRLQGSSMNQSNDYSFSVPAQTEYPRITLYRDGSRIWGNEPK